MAKPPKSTPALISDIPVENKDQRAQLMFTHRDEKNRILGTLANMRDLLNYHGVTVRYNVISKRIFFNIPSEEFSMENGEDAAFACIYSLMKEWQLSTDNYQAYLMRIADENQYNPVMSYIRMKPWDKVSRLQQFYDTIQSPEMEAKELLIRRWLITAVAMAMGEGVDSAGCLVLQGPQDLGKTWWVKKLLPEDLRKELIRVDANVDPKDKDSVSQIISYWICELGEIGATFNRADLQAIKPFITRDHDTMRRPYGIGDKRYPRRTALIASVDQNIYLLDTAGNRRFWTIPCTSINSYHDINMQQLWAEILYLIEVRDETWQLAPDEKEHIRRINEQHMQIDPIEELIVDMYYATPATTGIWCSATEIGQKINLKTIGQKETRVIAGVVRKWNKNDKTKEKSSSGLKFFVPSPRI